jgi:hypothetical protein
MLVGDFILASHKAIPLGINVMVSGQNTIPTRTTMDALSASSLSLQSPESIVGRVLRQTEQR